MKRSGARGGAERVYREISGTWLKTTESPSKAIMKKPGADREEMSCEKQNADRL